jgi:hypothetical protein
MTALDLSSLQILRGDQSHNDDLEMIEFLVGQLIHFPPSQIRGAHNLGIKILETPQRRRRIVTEDFIAPNEFQETQGDQGV